MGCEAMPASTTRKRLFLRAPMASRARALAVARWARALLPTVTLIIAPFEGMLPEGAEGDDAIVLEVDDVGTGPLSLADAVAKAVRNGQ
jgi:hypothetical protein